jgi:serine/threonine protein kinase
MVEAGTRLGAYTILGPLGAGGMGEVYRAIEGEAGRDVAIKVLPAEYANDSVALGRFKREAKALNRITHPNVLTIYDYGVESGIVYAATELLEGETLRERLRLGPFHWREALRLAGDIAAGLVAIHASGVIHRDLKPENLFLTSGGTIKILDFGMARLHDDRLREAGDNDSGDLLETAPGVMVGTVLYMSPEQVCGLPIDQRSDVFSFGSVFYEMLAGRSPFMRRTSVMKMAAILREPAPDFAAIGIEAPAPVEALVMRCLEKDRERRYRSTVTLYDAIVAVAAQVGCS